MPGCRSSKPTYTGTRAAGPFFHFKLILMEKLAATTRQIVKEKSLKIKQLYNEDSHIQNLLRSSFLFSWGVIIIMVKYNN